MFFISTFIFSFFFLNHNFNDQEKIFTQENFIYLLEKDLEEYNISSDNPDLLNNTILMWKNRFSNLEKQKTIEILNIILNQRNETSTLSYYPFLIYINLLYHDKVILSSSFFQILLYHENQMKLRNTSYVTEIEYILNLLESKNFSLIKSKQIFYRSGSISFGLEKLEQEESEFFQEEETEETNLIIGFNNINLGFVSKQDSFTIKNTFVKYSDYNKSLEGKGGVLNFNREIDLIGNPVLTLGSYYLDQKNISVLSSNSNIKTNLPKIIEGIFEYNSNNKNNNNEKNHFIFTSHSNKITIPIDNKTKLISGLNIEGNKLSTSSSLNDKSKIIILLSQGNSVEFQSKNFLIETNYISSNDSRFVLYHNSDSLYHESVRLQYDLESRQLNLYRTKGNLKMSSYYSSFFDVSINADMLDWDLNLDSMLLKNITAANQRPVTLESSNYFSRQRVQQMTDMKGINILKIIVNYSNLKKQNEFYLNDVASHYKRKPNEFKSGLVKLWENGFIQYEPTVGFIKLNYKIKHYFYSQINRRDYDQIIINSISPQSKNLEFNIIKESMFINGVEQIILSEENNITIFPQKRKIELLKNRDIKCVGDITVGNFDFKGANMSFDYNKFLLKLDRIDTLRIKSRKVTDTLFTESVVSIDTLDVPNKEENNQDMYNYLYSIDGSIFINHPKNKSARRNLPNYPYFISDQGTGVYFDLPLEYGVEYDSTFYFTINQFRIDSLDKPQLPLFEFDGVFYSNNIFSPLQAKLITMPDKSLGFIKKTSEEGLGAYNNKIKVFETIQMDSKGLSGKGYINYHTTNLYYDNIKFFPDSSKAFIDKGYIIDGYDNNNLGPFPDMIITDMSMGFYYNNKKDSIMLDYFSNDSLPIPIKVYNESGLFTGGLTINNKGVFASGQLDIYNSKILSNSFDFKDKKFLSRFSDFLLYSDNKLKSSISGEELNIDFDLSINEVYLKPEHEGFASFSFPYSEIKTSITEGIWDLDNQLFIMEKKPKTDLSNSYFYSTNKSLDSLYFFGEKAIYDIESRQLNVSGTPNIKVADAYIIPDEGEVRILEESKIEKLTNATIILDTLDERHYFYKSDVNIFSKNKFSAEGIYKYVNYNEDTFNILFNSFETIARNTDLDKNYTTLSSGQVNENNPIVIDPGFDYKGKVQLYADKKDLIFDGQVSPSITRNIKNRSWVEYQGKFFPGDDFRLVLNNKQTIPNTIIYNIDKNQEMLFSFFDYKEKNNADPIFVSEGDIYYDDVLNQYVIEPIEKTNDMKYSGKSLSYSPKDKMIYFEGKTDLFKNNRDVQLESSSNGSFSLDSLNIQMNTLLTLDINLKPSLKTNLATNFINIVEQVGAPVAHANEEEVLTSLGALIGSAKTKKFEDELLMTGYSPLHLAAEELIKLFVFSSVDLKWSEKYKSWYNISKLNLANIGELEINASLDGFLEISKKKSSDYSMFLFIQPAPDYWCFFKYENNELLVFSSFEEFNSEAFELKKSQKDKYLWPDYGDEKITLKFVNNFIKKYFGINKSYDLSTPFSPFSEKEVFKTISDDDDGF